MIESCVVQHPFGRDGRADRVIGYPADVPMHTGSGRFDLRTRPTAVQARPPGPLGERLVVLADSIARSQRELVAAAAEFADSAEWVLAGWSSAAGWLADACDVEACTAREWIRIGRCLEDLPGIAAAFGSGELSYSKVRTLTRVEFDHNPPYETTHHTMVDELELRCAPCHHHRHQVA